VSSRHHLVKQHAHRPKPLAQRLTFNEFSRDETMAIHLADLMNRQNVRTVESGRGARGISKRLSDEVSYLQR
jgi:hypothetical protein